MKPLQNFWEDTIILCMLLKLIKLLEVLFVYWFVGSSHEMDVHLVAVTPLVDVLISR